MIGIVSAWRRFRALLRPGITPVKNPLPSPARPATITRQVRIRIPSSNPHGIADVLDDKTGEPLKCMSFDLHADHEHGASLKLELLDPVAEVVCTWEGRLVKERPR